MRSMRWWLFLLVFAAAMVSAAPVDLSLKDLSGKPHKLGEYIGRGQWTVVVFWAHDCPICKAEIIQMVFFQDAHRKKDAQVLGVSIDGDNVHDAQQFIDEQGLNFPNLITDPGTVSDFGEGRLIGTPTYYVYDPNGNFVAKRIGATTQEQIEQIMRAKKK